MSMTMDMRILSDSRNLDENDATNYLPVTDLIYDPNYPQVLFKDDLQTILDYLMDKYA